MILWKRAHHNSSAADHLPTANQAPKTATTVNKIPYIAKRPGSRDADTVSLCGSPFSPQSILNRRRQNRAARSFLNFGTFVPGACSFVKAVRLSAIARLAGHWTSTCFSNSS